MRGGRKEEKELREEGKKEENKGERMGRQQKTMD